MAGSCHTGDSSGAAPWQGIRTLLNKGRVFIDLAMNPTILDYMRYGFRGMEFYLSSTNGLILRHGAVPMVTHTDQLYVPFQSAMPLVMNVMVCLSDFTEDMGATRVVPRSHLRPPPRIEVDYEKMDAINPDQIETVPAECEAGSAIVFEGRLWHCSGGHRSDRTRWVQCGEQPSIAASSVLRSETVPQSDSIEILGTLRVALTGWRSGVDSNLRCREKPLRRKRGEYWETFGVEVRQHPPESEFAVSSVGVPSSTLNSGVTRLRGPTNSTLAKAAARGIASPVLMATRLAAADGPVELADWEHEQKTTTGQLAIIWQSRISRCLVHSSGSGALRLSTSAVSVAGCAPSHTLWTISGASSASGMRRFT